jgi:hypothetical protein
MPGWISSSQSTVLPLTAPSRFYEGTVSKWSSKHRLGGGKPSTSHSSEPPPRLTLSCSSRQTAFKPLLEAGADLVIASRMMDGAFNEEDIGWFRPRKWVNVVFGWMAKLAWGLGQKRITDTINGYRAITIEAWDRLDLNGPGYTIEYQMSIRAYKARLAVTEFPTVEGARIGGESEAKSFSIGIRFIRLYLSELRRRPT